MIENRSLVSQDGVVGWMIMYIRRPVGVIHVSIVLIVVMVSGNVIKRLWGEEKTQKHIS